MRPSASAPHCTAARFEKKVSTASKKESRLELSENAGKSSISARSDILVS
jgi:hypothetical protein